MSGEYEEKSPSSNKSIVNVFVDRYETMTRHGGFSDPSEMIYLLKKYFDWIEENPLYEGKSAVSKGEVLKWREKVERTPSMTGFALFCGMSSAGLKAYASRPLFKDACCIVQDCINEQRFVLASGNLINGQFITKILQNESNFISGDNGNISLTEAGQVASHKLTQYIDGIAGNARYTVIDSESE